MPLSARQGCGHGFAHGGAKRLVRDWMKIDDKRTIKASRSQRSLRGQFDRFVDIDTGTAENRSSRRRGRRCVLVADSAKNANLRVGDTDVTQPFGIARP